MRKTFVFISLLTLIAVIVFVTACGSGSNNVAKEKTIASGPAGNNLTASLSNATGALRTGAQEFTLTFEDVSGKPVDVGSVALTYRMVAMGSMSEMNSGTTFTTSGTPGVYRGKAEIYMAGEWKAQISYEGTAGNGSLTLPIIAK
jgi:hypothetical protein